MSTYPQIRSKRQLIRLWFDCLKICHSISDYTDNLKQSETFYREWGDISDIKFDDWWREKKHLFDDYTVTEIDKVKSNPYVVNVSIPLNQNISTSIKEVRQIVEQRQLELMEELGEDQTGHKSRYPKAGKYSFSQKEIKGRYHYQNIEMYKLYLEFGKPPINRDFLLRMYETLKDRPKSLLWKSIGQLSDVLYESRNVDVDDQIRSVRRGLKSVEKVLRNVSLGRFP
jgi:hypothetical protein